MNENKPNQNSSKPRQIWLSIIIHALIIMTVGLILIWGLSEWLKHWTRHDDVVYVPDVKGMHFDEAKTFLLNNGFEVVLSDSVYEDKTKRGAVVDQNPKDSTTVRSGRTIYLTVNAFYPRMVYIPTLTDISVRQARAALEGIGIKNIKIKEIPSDYKDLVYGALWNGKQLTPGSRVPLTATIVLEVGKGVSEEEVTPEATSPTTSSDNATNKAEAPIAASEPSYFD